MLWLVYATCSMAMAMERELKLELVHVVNEQRYGMRTRTIEQKLDPDAHSITNAIYMYIHVISLLTTSHPIASYHIASHHIIS